MKRTGIKATEDEVASLRAAASAPVMMVGGTTPRDPAAMAHEIALQHGLPEIPGFYGLDLATGEFLAADNAVLPSTLTDAVAPSARDRVEKVFGKAVHPLAIDRLLVLWPDVHVEVTHSDGYHDGMHSQAGGCRTSIATRTGRRSASRRPAKPGAGSTTTTGSSAAASRSPSTER